ncbi:glycosyltransferase [Mucilaginibacter terrae]|uniref:glycosyltransferase n=1 Tax=Mucilaginibacter terrae TaxID=1955052 RepID=UPI00362F35A9
MKEIIFINSHPIQYFAPLYKYLNEHGVKTKAWYGSDESIKGGMDKQFGAEVKWDIPLLQGYEYEFFKNYSWKPSHFNGFFGLISLGMIKRLFSMPKSVIIVHGWHYFSHLIVLLTGSALGHTICLRCEMPQNQEMLKTGWKQSLKKLGLKYLLFPRINYFLNIGTQNRLFYKSYGIDDKKIIFCPYSVDNDRFGAERASYAPKLQEIRTSMGIAEIDKVILYSGKYITKKRPLDLLKAYIKLNKPNCWLLMVGEGELRADMEVLIKEHGLNKVILTGFINQSKISEFYAISDVFVMCSTIGETWGLSINEAMNFDLPLVVSDQTGSAGDLVKEGVNGYTFETANVDELAVKLNKLLYQQQLSWSITSQQIVNEYSYATIARNMAQITG